MELRLFPTIFQTTQKTDSSKIRTIYIGSPKTSRTQKIKAFFLFLPELFAVLMNCTLIERYLQNANVLQKAYSAVQSGELLFVCW